MENSSDGNIGREKTFKIPKAVPFILINVLLERYSTTGISAVLLLYLHEKLGFDQNTSTAIFHTNELLSYFFPIFGAIIADSYWGLFKTLLIMSLVFAVGGTTIAIGGIEPFLNLPVMILTFCGMIISVVGSGSVRANLTAFGGNQYKIPQESENLKLYFSIQIVFLKCGSLIGRAINPIIRQDVKCFGMDDCYPLAFGIPAITMIIALIILLSGNSFYTHKSPTGNVLVKLCGCVCLAIKEKFKCNQNIKKDHWIDYADKKYDVELINATKKVLKILILFLPIPIYWAVYMQQSSKWIFQATRMNGDLGFFTIKPDQMIALNPIFAIILMPACNYIFFPLMNKLKLPSLLHRIFIGGMLCCAAFIISIFVEIKIQKHEKISILWLFPQFAVLALSENFAFTSLLNFAYSEAPSNMKSVMTACVFVTIALGNLIITIVSGMKIFNSQIIEFSFFVILLAIVMIIFMILSSRYQKQKDKNAAN